MSSELGEPVVFRAGVTLRRRQLCVAGMSALALTGVMLALFSSAAHDAAPSSRVHTLQGAGGVALQASATSQFADTPPYGMYIAAFAAGGDTSLTAGDNANLWGLWISDPGPLGAPKSAVEAGTIPFGYDEAEWSSDYWKEEHDLVMPSPTLLPAGTYVVYGDLGPRATLEVGSGGQWSLSGATLDQVTHHPCKAIRYRDGAQLTYQVLIVQSAQVHTAPWGAAEHAWDAQPHEALPMPGTL